jgi:alpha-beta hydrolase superfamily lysophospholipase
MERIALATSDGIRVIGDYYPSQNGKGALLLHMMPATRASWREFALELQRKGYHVLALDLRGHGESDGGPERYQGFADREHQASIHDVEAGTSFLKSKGVLEEQLVLAGASIGANLALQYMAEHSNVRQAVLLSAGLNYRGIETLPMVSKLKSGQRVFFATSLDDRVTGNAQMNKEGYETVPSGVDKKLTTYQHAGHGTDMLGKEPPDLATEIINWLR